MAKIAVSNIAWHESEDEQVFSVMRNLEISCLEISPFRDDATIPEVKKRFNEKTLGLLRQYGIDVVAFQALMFRYPKISLFENYLVR